MSRNHQQGFTLIEAAVAIAVVAILSGIIVPLVVKNLNDSQIARAKNDVQVIAAAVASQLKDTGSRPSAAATAGTGAANALWGSGSATAVLGAGITTEAGAASAVMPGTTQTFYNLFCQTQAEGRKLFGFTAAGEFDFKGPYIAPDAAAKTDPWGRPYVIIGYNANSQGATAALYVVSAGPDGKINATNGTVTPVATWNVTLSGSEDDVVVRVN